LDAFFMMHSGLIWHLGRSLTVEHGLPDGVIFVGSRETMLPQGRDSASALPPRDFEVSADDNSQPAPSGALPNPGPLGNDVSKDPALERSGVRERE
jgi:hypothetical protein